MANRKSIAPFYEGLIHALLIEVLAFLVAYTVAKAAGWVE